MSKEKEFAKAYAKDWEELQYLVKTAEEATSKAKALADASGLPFETPLGLYVPESFEDKFYRIDPEFVATLTDINSWDLEAKLGWRASSANC